MTCSTFDTAIPLRRSMCANEERDTSKRGVTGSEWFSRHRSEGSATQVCLGLTPAARPPPWSNARGRTLTVTLPQSLETVAIGRRCGRLPNGGLRRVRTLFPRLQIGSSAPLTPMACEVSRPDPAVQGAWTCAAIESTVLAEPSILRRRWQDVHGWLPPSLIVSNTTPT